MTARQTRIRLLPVTIGVLAAALVAKSVDVARAPGLGRRATALIDAAFAAGTEPAPARPDATANATQSGKPDPRTAQRPTAGPTAGPTPGPAGGPDATQARSRQPAAAEASQADDKAPAPEITDAERAVLLKLRDRRAELDAREAALTARESLLGATEMKLTARVDELRALQQKLEALEAARKQQEDTAWQGLVKVYETMKPRDAATIFNDLGMPVLLAVVDRMKEAKAAAILAAMQPDKARDVTTELAALRSRGEAVTGTKPTIPAEPGKGPGSGT